MTKEEFLKLTGIRQMSDPDYDKVNFVYTQLENMDKQTFCELYVNNQPELLNEMAHAIAEENMESNRYQEALNNAALKCLISVRDQSLDPIEEVLEDIEFAIGKNAMILNKLKLSKYFSNEETNYIMSRLE